MRKWMQKVGYQSRISALLDPHLPGSLLTLTAHWKLPLHQWSLLLQWYEPSPLLLELGVTRLLISYMAKLVFMCFLEFCHFLAFVFIRVWVQHFKELSLVLRASSYACLVVTLRLWLCGLGDWIFFLCQYFRVITWKVGEEIHTLKETYYSSTLFI